MPCIGRHTFSGRDFQNRQPYCDKQLRFISLTKLFIHIRQNLCRGTSTYLGPVFDQRLGDHHKQCRRNTFSGNISHHHSQMILIHQKEIVEISSHFFSRSHGCINFKLIPIRESRENTGKHICLDLRSHVQLRTDPLFFRRHFCQIFDILLNILLHLLHRACQKANLILILHSLQSGRSLMFIGKPFCLPGDLQNRADNTLIKEERIQNKHQQNDHYGCQHYMPCICDSGIFQNLHSLLHTDHRNHFAFGIRNSKSRRCMCPGFGVRIQILLCPSAGGKNVFQILCIFRIRISCRISKRITIKPGSRIYRIIDIGRCHII